jgi:uncharacterized membrane protein YkvA (DUF1232 family)
MKDRLRDWARVIKRDVRALYLASRDPRVPWYAKALAIVVAGYHYFGSFERHRIERSR